MMLAPGAMLLKVLIASLLISLAIKWGGKFLPLPPTPPTALGMILLPTVIFLALFTRRTVHRNKPAGEGSSPEN